MMVDVGPGRKTNNKKTDSGPGRNVVAVLPASRLPMPDATSLLEAQDQVQCSINRLYPLRGLLREAMVAV